jgi:hypothetical protein
MEPPIQHWTFSSLTAFLRNPLAWHKRYVEKIYDMPASPSSIVGRAGHTALQHFYGGISKEGAVDLGLQYLRSVPDFEINFGVRTSARAKKQKRTEMEREYHQAVAFYLARPPRYDVLGVEVSAVAKVKDLPLPLKAVSDLVVRSKVDRNAVDIVDHKFVDTFSKLKADKSLFMLQALFNYYTVREAFKKPVRRFIVHECKKRKNQDGSSQMRRYIIEFDEKRQGDFALFHRLIKDATAEVSRTRVFLPNPSDLFEGEDSLNLYRLGLIG